MYRVFLRAGEGKTGRKIILSKWRESEVKK